MCIRDRHIFDRVPKPPAAPAKLIISPIAARRDAEREENPASQYPRPHRARKRRADLARDQRADGEAERDRQADIADVKRGRMEGEPDVCLLYTS